MLFVKIVDGYESLPLLDAYTRSQADMGEWDGWAWRCLAEYATLL